MSFIVLIIVLFVLFGGGGYYGYNRGYYGERGFGGGLGLIVLGSVKNLGLPACPWRADRPG